MKRKYWLLLLVFSVLLPGSPVLADGDFYVVAAGGGVGTKIASLPYTISAPGFYYLGGNLSNTRTDTAINVNANGVTIDLMGFCLNGSEKLGMGISLNSNNVEIRNGTVRNFAIGIMGQMGTSDHRILNVRAVNNTSCLEFEGTGQLVKGCEVTGDSGIRVNCSVVSGNTVHDCVIGIYANGDSLISGNAVRNCSDKGITTNDSATVSANSVNYCAIGIFFFGGSLIGNAVQCFTDQTGIWLYTGQPCMLDQNTVIGEGTHYSGGGSNTVWAGKSATYPYGNNAGAPLPSP
jgi:hypothetical protein